MSTITGIFDDDFDSFVGELTDKLTKHTEENFSNLTPDKIEVSIGKKWAKILRKRQGSGYLNQSGGSAYAFVAMTDFQTKGLGEVKRGDIHKPANWHTPAKHARGSIFKENRLDCCGPYGVQYLRG